jgi:hypothetical protein
MSESLERLARNQALFREVNEQIETLPGSNQEVEFVCECSDTDCVSTVEVSIQEYERVRSNATWFIIRRGHEVPEIERVISQADGYAIVEKLVEREFAQETDARS